MEKTYKQKLYDVYLKIIPTIEYLETERKKLSSFGLFFRENKFSQKYKSDLKSACFDKILGVFNFIKSKSSEFYNSLILNGYIQTSMGESDKIITVCDDTFEGIYKDVNFRISEIKEAMIRGVNDVYSGLWSGVFFEIKFNKKINTFINIIPKTDSSDSILLAGYIFIIYSTLIVVISSLFFSIFSSYYSFWIFDAPFIIFAVICTVVLIWILINRKFNKVNLEDVNFIKKYNVESTNQIEARYILTPAFMERLENLKTAFKSKDIRVFLRPGTMTVAIGTRRDLFEIGDVSHSIYDFKQLEQFYNELTAIIGIIDHFKLDEKTGL